MSNLAQTEEEKADAKEKKKKKKKVEPKETAQDSGTQLVAFFKVPLGQSTIPLPWKVFRVRIIEI